MTITIYSLPLATKFTSMGLTEMTTQVVMGH